MLFLELLNREEWIRFFVFHDKLIHSDFLSNHKIKIKSEPARLPEADTIVLQGFR